VCVLASGVIIAALTAAGAAAAEPVQVTLAVDAREVTRGILHVRESIPGAQGEVKLVYPKWIPGEHQPSGPIINLAALIASSGGERLAWRRDPVDMYAFYVTVPAGKRGLDLAYDYLGADVGHYSSARLATPNIMVLTWNKVLLTPDVADYRDVVVTPSITLPSPDWQYATALEPGSQLKSSTSSHPFAPVSMEMLVDSPLDAGLNVKRIPLGEVSGAPVDIAIFADTADELAISDARLAKLKNLVREMGALYGARHFNHYTFLLTVSDQMAGEGVEHHQSSDDGTSSQVLVDEEAFVVNMGSLLAHEFNHSWDGKYRRPADLATPNLQVPMQDDLLWVYEGMTQFYGELQAARSGIYTTREWIDALAGTYADLDARTGRHSRSLLDTAVSAPFLYDAPSRFGNIRRYVDFYDEGQLLWLLADVTIRTHSGGTKSIDDFARAFFGGRDTGPEVVTYTRTDVIAALNAVQPYDWAGFFARYVDAVTDHPPDPFELAGWRLSYGPERNAFSKRRHDKGGGFSAWYSLGFYGSSDGTITDVREGSPAALAGIGPGMRLIGVDGRTFGGSEDTLDTALNAARAGGGVRLLLTAGGTYREVSIDYRNGPRFPRLERIPNTADLLTDIAKPEAPLQAAK
jgi:predicted metalloprotease with PDZ domain